MMFFTSSYLHIQVEPPPAKKAKKASAPEPTSKKAAAKPAAAAKKPTATKRTRSASPDEGNPWDDPDDPVSWAV